MSWVKQKATPNLKEAKAETIVARPSLGKEGVVEKLRPDDVGNAGDVDIPGGEGGGHRSLSHWKRYAWKDIGIDTLEYLKKSQFWF